jgi:hypothetical protein
MALLGALLSFVIGNPYAYRRFWDCTSESTELGDACTRTPDDDPELERDRERPRSDSP